MDSDLADQVIQFAESVSLASAKVAGSAVRMGRFRRAGKLNQGDGRVSKKQGDGRVPDRGRQAELNLEPG